MKLSTAIRIGSMTTKQIRCHFTDGGNGRCALGAAIDATGEKVAVRGFCQANSLFPILTLTSSRPTLFGRFGSLIADWNDISGMSREWIADRVEQVEDALEHDGHLTTGVTESKPIELIAMEAK